MSDEIINTNLDNGREHRVGADLYDWQFNNTYDINNVVHNIKQFIDQLFESSLTAQTELCNISRFYGTMDKFVRDVNRNKELGIGYGCYTLEVPIRNIRCFNLIALKRANPTIYSIGDSCQKTELFERRLMMFVDGRFFPGIKFYADANRFILIIDTESDVISVSRMAELRANNTPWSIIMMPFSTTKYAYGLTTSLISNRCINLSKLTNISNCMFVNSNTWMVSIGTSSTEKSITRTALVEATTDVSTGDVYLQLTPDLVDDITSTYVSINIIAFPNSKGSVTLNLARAFQIEIDGNPIPPENIICWECDLNGSVIKYVHTATVTLHYPNVYTITNVDPTKYLFVSWLYSDIDTTQFSNPIDQYIDFNSHYANDVINDNLPVVLKEFSNMISTYTEPVYIKYFVKATARNEFTFKFETLKDLIADDRRRLEEIYKEQVSATKYKWHSNPKFIIHCAEWGNIMERRRRIYSLETIYFILEHEDEREYPVAVWVDGIRAHNVWIKTEGFRSTVDIAITETFSQSSIIEIEILKVRGNMVTHEDIHMPSIHNSIQIPKSFSDISPQNLMVSVATEIPATEENGDVQILYKTANTYEMYWLMFGNTQYINGVPVGFSYDAPDSNDEINILTTNGNPTAYSETVVSTNTLGSNGNPNMYNENIVAADALGSNSTPSGCDGNCTGLCLGGCVGSCMGNCSGCSGCSNTCKGNCSGCSGCTDTCMSDCTGESTTVAWDIDGTQNALAATTGNDYSGGSFDYMAELGGNLIILPNEQYEEYTDVMAVKKLGYYGETRRRFYEYLPNGTDDPDLFITPITPFFADKDVRIQNIDIHWIETFTVTPTNKRFKLEGFSDELSVDRFRIFLNGKLLDPFIDYIMDASIKNGYYLGRMVNFAILTDITEDSQVLFEYMPYRHKLLYRINGRNDRIMQLRESLIKRPFSMVYYDVYVDGKKIHPEDISIITPSKIKFNIELNNSTISFYERGHDEEIYDNKDRMRKSIVDLIADEVPEFKEYLMS